MQLTQTHDLGDMTMAQAKTLTTAEIERLMAHITTRKYAARNRSMMLLTHWAGLRIGEVACLRWSDVTTTDGEIKDEIRLLPDMTKGRHARTVFVSAKLRAELQAYALQAKCVDRTTHSLLVRRVSGPVSMQTAWRKHSPYFTKELDLRVPAVTAGAERS
jgi:site-specific recombinase XerD